MALLNFDHNKIEVLIGSDCSDDRSNEILKELENKYAWLKTYVFKKRRGKASVLNDLADKSHNEILIFSDANTVFDIEAVKLLTAPFGDPKVGGVCGKLILIEPSKIEKGVEEKKYWDYETTIKKNEGRCGVLIGANGGIFAIRKILYTPIPIINAVTDDLFISLTILQQGYKFIYEEKAFAIEEVGWKIQHEFNRKIRFSATNFQTLTYFMNLLFNRKILLSYAFWSHKISRWFIPILLILILFISILLYNNSQFYNWLLYFQILFYSSSFVGYLLNRGNFYLKIFALPFYFTLSNIAILVGLIRFLFKRHRAFWESTPR